jgi:hypothetical protein
MKGKKVKGKKLSLEPMTLGERWYQYAVNHARTAVFPIVCVCHGVMFLVLHFLGVWKMSRLGMPMVVMWWMLALVYFERHIAYRVLKRKLEEIERLKTELSGKGGS